MHGLRRKSIADSLSVGQGASVTNNNIRIQGTQDHQFDNQIRLNPTEMYRKSSDRITLGSLVL